MSTRKISNLEKQDQQQAHIKVFIRLRPLRNQFSKKCVKIIDRGVALNFKDKIHQLYFDGSFDEAVTQSNVFAATCQPIVNDVLKGNNCSLFVYGQTGTGKTYTMGTLQTIKREDQGLISLSLNYIINHLQSSKKQNDWSVSLSFMQIYMQDIYDLLNPTDKKLQIRQDIEYGQTYVQDLVIVPISNYKQSIDLINAGLKYRKTGNQRMNQLSSRSHTILTIYVSQKVSQTEYLSSTLNLIDLAGSERIKKSNSVDQRLDEAKFINTSLSALGNVISSLAQNNTQKYVPYRSSKLTRILKNSLTGHSKVNVICTLDTSQQNQNQTYSTLLFADRCKQIRFPNQPIISVETFEELVQEKNLKTVLQKAKEKEKEYMEIIKNYQQGGSKYQRQSARELELSQIVEGIYKLFGQINIHLKKVLDPQQQASQTKPEYPKVTPSTATASIKGNITTMAQQTIGHINTLSSLAYGESKVSIQSSNSATKLEVETLTSLLLDTMRQNSKLYETILIKEQKDSLEKQIALEQFQKEKKEDVLNKLRNKKLKSLTNTFEQIWTQGHSSYNPLQNLLETIRKGDMSIYQDKSPVKTQQSQNLREFTNPKQFLKMLTKKQAQRKHKQMLIDQGQGSQGSEQDGQISQQRQDQSQVSSSGINYFKNSSARNNTKLQSSKITQCKDPNSGNSQIKKLLDSLIASKIQYQPKRKMFGTNANYNQ